MVLTLPNWYTERKYVSNSRVNKVVENISLSFNLEMIFWVIVEILSMNIKIYYKLGEKVSHIFKYSIREKQSQSVSEKVPAGNKIPHTGV